MAPDGLLDELAATVGSRREASWLLEEVAGDAAGDRAARARSLAARRADGEPVQYVLGHWPFSSLDLLVDPRALIPRPETEALVALASSAVAVRGDGAVVCDLGCGTGAIALAVAALAVADGLDVEVHATDVSPDALELAACNARRVAATTVTFHLGSWFDALRDELAGRVNVLCSNPPYVSANERGALARELDHEPELALVAGDGTDGTPGFAAVEAVVTGAPRWLAPGGTLLVEHAGTHRDAAVAAAVRAGLEVVADHDDLAGLPRVLEGSPGHVTARILSLDELDVAVSLLAAGAIVGVPTDTVYGIAARLGDADAVASLFSAKGRPSNVPIAVLCATTEQAASIATGGRRPRPGSRPPTGPGR